jgi:outer membrane usher protein FimD/PapC
VDKTPFGQLTGIYGLPKGFTLYGGVQESSKYQSIAFGVGKNMGSLVPSLQTSPRAGQPRIKLKKHVVNPGERVTARTL